VYVLGGLASGRSMSRRARAVYWMLMVAAAVAQLYSGVYLGWFLFLTLGLATIAALALRSCRQLFVDMVRRDLWAIVAAGAVGILLLQPFLSHYLQATRQLDPTHLAFRMDLHPYVCSWLGLGPGSWLWCWTSY